MFIGVKHDIKDAKTFWAKAEVELPKLPDGYKVVTAVSNKEGTNAFCIWECESVDKLKAFMQPIWGGALANNNYFEVDAEKAIGIPTAAK